MSGFAGVVRFGGSEFVFAEDAARTRKMAAAIAFRGPDAQIQWARAGVQFCFSFLKTGPALQAEHQPCSLDGQVWLLGDVRLDGRGEVIRKLEQSGERIEGAAPDEFLVLHVFHSFGEAGVAALDGDFSFVLWDERSRKLCGFRDLTGAKPFFYCASEGALSFSNTLDALRAAPGFDREFDENFLADYLLTSWCPEFERTVYRQIRRLPPGHLLQLSRDGLLVRRVAQLPAEELILYKRAEEYVEHYKELLHGAVEDRLPKGPCVVFMSGGLDSTAVAAVANQISKTSGAGGSVSAQTVDYRPLFEDKEGEEARRVAQFLQIPFELFHGGGCKPFSGWDAPGFPMPEPQNEPFQALHVECYRAAAATARVALTGNGGDDVLLGQAWPYLRGLLRGGQWLDALQALVGHIWNTRSVPILGLGIRSGIRNRFGGGIEQESYPEWIAEEFSRRMNLRERFTALQQNPTSEHPVHPKAYAMLSGPFWPNVLEGEDAAFTGVPVDTRAPLLDRRLVRYLLRLPTMPWCMDKHLMRRSMKGELPLETVERPKSPLAQDPLELQMAQGKWHVPPLAEYAAALSGIVDTARLENCLERNKAKDPSTQT